MMFIFISINSIYKCKRLRINLNNWKSWTKRSRIINNKNYKVYPNKEKDLERKRKKN